VGEEVGDGRDPNGLSVGILGFSEVHYFVDCDPSGLWVSRGSVAFGDWEADGALCRFKGHYIAGIQAKVQRGDPIKGVDSGC